MSNPAILLRVTDKIAFIVYKKEVRNCGLTTDKIFVLMNIGISVKFYEQSKPDEIIDGKLYIDENGKDYIDFIGGLKYAFVTMPIVFATSIDSDEKYTLINCFFRKSTLSSVRSVISELFRGDFLPKVTEKKFLEVTVRMTGLTSWLNHSRIKAQIPFSTMDESKIFIKEFFRESFSIGPNIELELSEFCSQEYSQGEVILRDESEIKIISKTAVGRLYLFHDAIAFLKLLSLFTERLPKLTQLQFKDDKGQSIENLSIKRQSVTGDNGALLCFDQLQPYWTRVLELFYKSRKKFVRVLNLLNESITNHTAEISFLNLTTACEVFHKYFYEDNNNGLRNRLGEELFNAGIIDKKPSKWDQIVRYYHLFTICNDIRYINQRFPDALNIVSLMRDSRNYYTHYTPTKNNIWTPNQLVRINRGLRQVIRAIILKQLQMPFELIDTLLFKEPDVIFYDYENNEYSLYHLPPSSDEV
jgi:hypothetical protein